MITATPEQIERVKDILLPLYAHITSDVTDVKILANNKTYLKRAGVKPQECVGKTISARNIESLGLLLAAMNDTQLNTENTILECDLPTDGSRITIIIPPTVKSASLYLRVPHRLFLDLDRQEESGLFTHEQRLQLEKIVRDKKNIIISGETGSGKTTLLSSLLTLVDESEHLVFIEDTREIMTDHELTTAMLVSKKTPGDACVKATLREDPDRIIYGEVRDGAALFLLRSWNTGHTGGMATIHANSAEDVYSRLADMCLERAQAVPELTIRIAMQVVIQIGFVNGKRKIVDIKDYTLRRPKENA